ncbi:MAG: TetR/AcrR family transcriptional regulator [Acidimicrobiales bacterium]
MAATSTEMAGRSRSGGDQALLRNAAVRLINREGVLSDLRLQDIADEAGVSRGLIHHYFGGRGALLRSALADFLETHRAAIEAERTQHGAPLDRRALFRNANKHPGWAVVMALLAIDGVEGFRPIDQPDEVFADVRRYIDEGVLPDDLDVEASHCVTLSTVLGWSLLREHFAEQLGIGVDELDRRGEHVLARQAAGFRT